MTPAEYLQAPLHFIPDIILQEMVHEFVKYMFL